MEDLAKEGAGEKTDNELLGKSETTTSSIARRALEDEARRMRLR